MSSLAGKVVLITGGAQGVGAEVAHRLHARNAKLVLTDLQDEPLKKIGAQLGGDERVLTVVADVCDPAAMQSAVDQAVSHFGGLDVVVANAGIFHYGSVLGSDPAAFKRVIDIDVVGVVNTVRAALPAIIQRRGYVLIVSSLAAYAAAPGMTAYDTAKAAVEQFANALRLEVVDRGVAVGSAHMSWLDTPMVRNAKAEMCSFRDMVARLPWPLNVTTSVDKCGAAFVKGIEGRKSHIYCPEWVAVFRWLRPLLALPPVEYIVAKRALEPLTRMDAERR